MSQGTPAEHLRRMAANAEGARRAELLAEAEEAEHKERQQIDDLPVATPDDAAIPAISATEEDAMKAKKCKKCGKVHTGPCKY